MSLQLELEHSAPYLQLKTQIPRGQISALVGPSGSGKTSILRAIAGLLRVERGQISLHHEFWDKDQHHLPTRQRSIGMVPQHHALFPHLSVLGNVEIALTDLPIQQKRQRAAECLRLAQVQELAERLPHQLSGGQRQRAALARAIARNPQILLLDEPFSAMDRSLRKRLYLELRKLHQQLGNTILLVTHDLDEAAQLASHLFLLDEGKLLQEGPTHQVLTRPANERAARLLDIPNIFSATLEAAPRDQPVLRWGENTLKISAQTDIPAGQVKFAILPQNLLLIKNDKPWGHHLENPVKAQVSDIVTLGGEIVIFMNPQGLANAQLEMRLPERALHRYPLNIGSEVTVCMRPHDIVLLQN